MVTVNTHTYLLHAKQSSIILFVKEEGFGGKFRSDRPYTQLLCARIWPQRQTLQNQAQILHKVRCLQ